MDKCEKCERTKKNPRDDSLQNNLFKRLNKISGQLSGVNQMIKSNRYCGDILIQISAIEAALKEVGYLIYRDHMMSCVAQDIKNNDFNSLEEAIEISKKLI